jgi:hypothetical protein
MNDSNPYETDDLKEYKRLVFLKRTFVPTESGERADLCVLRSDLVFLPVDSPQPNRTSLEKPQVGVFAADR